MRREAEPQRAVPPSARPDHDYLSPRIPALAAPHTRRAAPTRQRRDPRPGAAGRHGAPTRPCGHPGAAAPSRTRHTRLDTFMGVAPPQPSGTRRGLLATSRHPSTHTRLRPAPGQALRPQAKPHPQRGGLTSPRPGPAPGLGLLQRTSRRRARANPRRHRRRGFKDRRAVRCGRDRGHHRRDGPAANRWLIAGPPVPGQTPAKRPPHPTNAGALPSRRIAMSDERGGTLCNSHECIREAGFRDEYDSRDATRPASTPLVKIC